MWTGNRSIQEGGGEELVWEEKLRTYADLAPQAERQEVCPAASWSHGRLLCCAQWVGSSLVGQVYSCSFHSSHGPVHFSQMTKSRGDTLDQRTLASL